MEACKPSLGLVAQGKFSSRKGGCAMGSIAIYIRRINVLTKKIKIPPTLHFTPLSPFLFSLSLILYPCIPIPYLHKKAAMKFTATILAVLSAVILTTAQVTQELTAPSKNFNVSSPLVNGLYVVGQDLPCTYQLLNVDTSSKVCEPSQLHH